MNMSNVIEIIEALWPRVRNEELDVCCKAIQCVCYDPDEQRWWPAKDQLRIIFTELSPLNKVNLLVENVYDFLVVAREHDYTPEMTFYGYTDDDIMTELVKTKNIS
jgi:hypothetical protein